jgi:hypothetical protein
MPMGSEKCTSFTRKPINKFPETTPVSQTLFHVSDPTSPRTAQVREQPLLYDRLLAENAKLKARLEENCKLPQKTFG